MLTPETYFTKNEQEYFEGFDIFECDLSYSFQKNDEEEVFKTDKEAWEFVWNKAQTTEIKTYSKILEFIRLVNKEEYDELSFDILNKKIKSF